MIWPSWMLQLQSVSVNGFLRVGGRQVSGAGPDGARLVVAFGVAIGVPDPDGVDGVDAGDAMDGAAVAMAVTLARAIGA